MNEKQIIFLYRKFKKFFDTYSGRVPDDEITTAAIELYSMIMSLTEKSRQESEEIDTQIRKTFNGFLLVLQSLESKKEEI